MSAADEWFAADQAEGRHWISRAHRAIARAVEEGEMTIEDSCGNDGMHAMTALLGGLFVEDVADGEEQGR